MFGVGMQALRQQARVAQLPPESRVRLNESIQLVPLLWEFWLFYGVMAAFVLAGVVAYFVR